MGKISQLPPDSSPSADDYTVTVDSSTNQTKKVRLSDLVTSVVNQMSSTAITKRTLLFDNAGGIDTQTIGTTFTDTTWWTEKTFSTTGGDIVIHVALTYFASNANNCYFRLVIDGSTYSPSSTGWAQYNNETSSHRLTARTLLLTGLSSGSHTIKLQMRATSGNVYKDTNDYLNLLLVEYIH